ncbi:Uncharacterized protein OBRU01_07917 [Operophtera brumata]|uniref:Pickpocket n=1 Tax=Operophtera brumata TaxID=104452 RepID=A0A0L7L972_OPEBR|nr:Uncharacterized protein OBRU01_07917 [Operophtera brumata]
MIGELEKVARVHGAMNLKKQRKKRQKLIIKDLCVDYARNSTLHGLRYVTASGLTLIEKLFWMSTFFMSVALCGYLIGNVYHKWTNSPVIVSVSEKLVSVGSVPFPSVTICPQIKTIDFDFSIERNYIVMFKEDFTADGLCFNMNGVVRSDILRNVTLKHDKKRIRGWSMEKGYSDLENDPFPIRGNKNLASPDLEIYLRSREIYRDPLCNSLKSGFEIYLHHPADYPQSSLYHYSALSGEVTSLAVSLHAQSTSDSLARYSPEVRQCYFQTDRYLRYFKNYTTKNCEAECLSNYTKEHCGCVGCRCLPVCNSVEYNAEVLRTAFVTENFEGKGRCLQDGIFSHCFKYDNKLANNIAKVEIYFKKSQFMSFHRSELFGTTDFLANIGGLLGLFLGFSFLSLMEILYFITLRLGLAIRRNNADEKKIKLENNQKKLNITTIS